MRLNRIVLVMILYIAQLVENTVSSSEDEEIIPKQKKSRSQSTDCGEAIDQVCSVKAT